MQVSQFLHKFVSESLPEVHQTRRRSLLCTVSSLLDQGQLTLTALGRNMSGSALVKHKIKRVDRLLGNTKLLSERFYIYRQITHRILKNLSEAIIIVDWSGCCSQQRWILQASLAMSGRSIPIYQEIHPLSRISNPKVEKRFLDQLQRLIPKNIQVTVVTDAGFKTPWFRAVRQCGWHYIGRLRSRVLLNFGDDVWRKTTFFNGKIKSVPVFLGCADLGKTRKLVTTNIYAYQEPHKGRKRKRKKYYNDGYPDKNIKYGRAHREPWILATSLPGNLKMAHRIINIYRSRMQIEQNFRDLKNQRWGFGLRDSRTENPERLEILLLISFIASVILWLIGIVAESNKVHYGFQANTVRGRRTLSLFTLGWQIFKHGISGRFNLGLKEAYTELGVCYDRLLA